MIEAGSKCCPHGRICPAWLETPTETLAFRKLSEAEPKRICRNQQISTDIQSIDFQVLDDLAIVCFWRFWMTILHVEKIKV